MLEASVSTGRKKEARLSARAALSFFLILALNASLIGITLYNRHIVEQLRIQPPLAEAGAPIGGLSVRVWYEYPEAWLAIFFAVCVSFWAAALVQRNQWLKEQVKELEALSSIDPLTGIHNRRHFADSALKQMDRVARTNAESFTIMFDLDHFKQANDRYGHQAGDTVLKEITLRVLDSLRSYDLFARYGGEEFIIFVADIDKEATISLTERIRQNIEKTPIDIGGAHITVTASFGIAPAAPVNKLDTAIALADVALYKAKETGRNKVVFNENIC